MKIRRYLAWMLVLCVVFSIGYESTAAAVSAKSRREGTINSVSLKIGKKDVTKKIYSMKPDERKKLKVEVVPEEGRKTIEFTTSNKKTAVVSKSGEITARRSGTAKIKVRVKFGKATKTTWVKVKVKKSSGTDKNPTETETPEITNPAGDKKSIVVYFSCTDNTKRIAEYIAESADADIYRIEAAQPYTSADLDYNNPDSRTSRENSDATVRPEIAGKLPSLEGYENVYVGYPIWHGEAPKIMYAFVEQYDFSGKRVIPFCTSASSGIGASAVNLKEADSSKSVWMTGRRFSGSVSKSEVEGWLLELGLNDKG